MTSDCRSRVSPATAILISKALFLVGGGCRAFLREGGWQASCGSVRASPARWPSIVRAHRRSGMLLHTARSRIIDSRTGQRSFRRPCQAEQCIAYVVRRTGDASKMQLRERVDDGHRDDPARGGRPKTAVEHCVGSEHVMDAHVPRMGW